MLPEPPEQALLAHRRRHGLEISKSGVLDQRVLDRDLAVPTRVGPSLRQQVLQAGILQGALHRNQLLVGDWELRGGLEAVMQKKTLGMSV